ncbi:hypothetical protein [Paludibacterium purpuratum]|uniref:Uncharacterized protein n=1 Tax=Paludibacterium purpuratum TaxID=1144873 RepID=A0A4R7BB50_9NEIS|nr:hypothetical protein [Paludibacterium purpuratum]TDR82174.1 hypothetical protein DFP86_102288 [Paludibacterium purpuratum]
MTPLFADFRDFLAVVAKSFAFSMALMCVAITFFAGLQLIGWY